jgi:hypothetical protein
MNPVHLLRAGEIRPSLGAIFAGQVLGSLRL